MAFLLGAIFKFEEQKMSIKEDKYSSDIFKTIKTVSMSTFAFRIGHVMLSSST